MSFSTNIASELHFSTKVTKSVTWSLTVNDFQRLCKLQL